MYKSTITLPYLTLPYLTTLQYWLYVYICKQYSNEESDNSPCSQCLPVKPAEQVHLYDWCAKSSWQCPPCWHFVFW